MIRILNCFHQQVEACDKYNTLYTAVSGKCDDILWSTLFFFFCGAAHTLTFGTLLAHPFIIDNIVTPSYVAAWIANARRGYIVLSSQSQRAWTLNCRLIFGVLKDLGAGCCRRRYLAGSRHYSLTYRGESPVLRLDMYKVFRSTDQGPMGKPGGCELVSLWPDAVHGGLSRLFTAFATPYFVAYDEIGPHDIPSPTLRKDIPVICCVYPSNSFLFFPYISTRKP